MLESVRGESQLYLFGNRMGRAPVGDMLLNAAGRWCLPDGAASTGGVERRTGISR